MQQKHNEKPKAPAFIIDAKRRLSTSVVEEESCTYPARTGEPARFSSSTVLNAHSDIADHDQTVREAAQYEHGQRAAASEQGHSGAPLSNKKKRSATRHSPAIVAHLEALFQECPNPNERERRELSRRSGLTVEQVRYWFQNRRTQVKSENSRRENTALKDENSRLRAENLVLRHAMDTASCPYCGGPVAIQKSLEMQQLKLENASIQDQLDGYYGLDSKLHLDKPAKASTVGNLEVFHKTRNHNTQNGLLSTNFDQDLTAIEKDMIAELALVALEEFMAMAYCNEPLWAIPPGTHREILNFDEYLHQFPRGIGPKPDGYHSEATRETSTITADAHFVVESLMDAKRWMELFPCIVTKADMGEIISAGSPGTQDGALQLMFAELQVPSPIVPTWQVYFLRFCKMLSGDTWAIVDVSVDNLRGDSLSTAHKCRKRPSGCLVQQLPDGFSKITWMEHFEFDDSIHQHHYRPLVMDGIAFGAQRWLTTLRRQCAWHAILIANSLSSRGVGSEEAARVALLKLGQSMTKQLCYSVSGSLGWVTLTGNHKTNGGERVMMRESAPLNPYDRFGMILSAATSIWLPAPPHLVFEFLSNPDSRKQWDVLSFNGTVEELISVCKGQDPGNCVSLFRPKLGNDKMLILQDCCSDALSSTFVYAPVDMSSMNEMMRAENFLYKGKPILPSGFVIMPDGRAVETSNPGGSLVTVMFQLLVSRKEEAKFNLESINMMNTLIRNTVQSIKDGMKSNELSNQEEAQSSKTFSSDL
ncbi:hypothetical protein L7F22_033400 [Adiantum nelumboides]|nr:hypothetical protein [Adiantum nelumboides]